MLFIICFAVMFVFFVLAVTGVTAGTMLAVLGVAMILFKADFIITALAPEIMLFGGLAAAFFTAFLGLFAVKLGYLICRLYLRVERRCSRLRKTAELMELELLEAEELSGGDDEDLPDLKGSPIRQNDDDLPDLKDSPIRQDEDELPDLKSSPIRQDEDELPDLKSSPIRQDGDDLPD